MIRFFLGGAALCALAACQPAIPESGAPFDTQASAQRDAQLSRSPGQPAVPAPAPVASAPLDSTGAATERPLPASVTAAVNTDSAEAQARANAAAVNSGQAPVDASPSNPAPAAVSNPGISSEQDFGAVSSQRSIESDAQRIATNRQQYRVIEPTDLPTRPGSNQPNIVAYALQTNNPVGAQIFRRTNLRSAQRHVAACAGYPSPDQAQIDFLSRGGPQRDRKGLDPDGDGYACSWDPTPFRGARANAPAQAEPNAVVEPLAISSE